MLSAISTKSILELNRMIRPSKAVKLVAQAACQLLGILPDKVEDGGGKFKKVLDWWGPARRIFNSTFVGTFAAAARATISKPVIEQLQATASDPLFVDHHLKAGLAPRAALVLYTVIRSVILQHQVSVDLQEPMQLEASLQAQIKVRDAALVEAVGVQKEMLDDLYGQRVAHKRICATHKLIADDLAALKDEIAHMEATNGGLDLRTSHLFRDVVEVKTDLTAKARAAANSKGHGGGGADRNSDRKMKESLIDMRMSSSTDHEPDDDAYLVTVQGSIISVNRPVAGAGGQTTVDIEVTMAPCHTTEQADHFGTVLGFQHDLHSSGVIRIHGVA
jgi:hypothetical protein